MKKKLKKELDLITEYIHRYVQHTYKTISGDIIAHLRIRVIRDHVTRELSILDRRIDFGRFLFAKLEYRIQYFNFHLTA